MIDLPIALQVYSVREDLERDFEGTLRRVKALGYEGVEFAGLYGHTPAETKAICDEIGLTIVSSHVGIPELIEDAEGVIAAQAEMGVQFVVITWLPEEYRPGTPGFSKVIETARAAGTAAKKYGIRFAYHNHDFEFEKVGEKYALDVLYEEVPAELLETELDVCWIKVGGECPVKYLRKYAGRCHIVHLKDFAGIKGSEEAPFEFRPIGMGVQNWEAILGAAKQAGAQWLVVEQDAPSCGMNAFECVKASLSYLKNM